MSRSMNQTMAWITSGILSLALFGAGYAAFQIMVKGGGHAPADSGHDAHGETKAQHDEGHAAPAADHDVEVKSDHAAPHQEAPAAESHGADAHEPSAPADHAAPKDDSAGHKEDGEEEISADQFKSKSDPH